MKTDVSSLFDRLQTLCDLLSLPGEYKIRDGSSMWILRKSMAGRMRDEIVCRWNKLRFESAEDFWLPRHLPVVRDAVLASPLLRELCDPVKVGARLDRLDRLSQRRLYSVALWESAFGVSA